MGAKKSERVRVREGNAGVAQNGEAGRAAATKMTCGGRWWVQAGASECVENGMGSVQCSEIDEVSLLEDVLCVLSCDHEPICRYESQDDGHEDVLRAAQMKAKWYAGVRLGPCRHIGPATLCSQSVGLDTPVLHRLARADFKHMWYGTVRYLDSDALKTRPNYTPRLRWEWSGCGLGMVGGLVGIE